MYYKILTMEKNIAILIADLSGYTALTETHGATSAANLIDKYIRIAENCLVGDSKIHQRTGDEIMFISDYPDFLLATALNLETNAIAGTFWCSDDFVKSLTNKSICAFKPMGSHLFKNINGQKKIYEVSIEKTKTTLIDPICRMLIVNPQNAFHLPNENQIYFCSIQCREEYNKNQSSVQCIEMHEQS